MFWLHLHQSGKVKGSADITATNFVNISDGPSRRNLSFRFLFCFWTWTNFWLCHSFLSNISLVCFPPFSASLWLTLFPVMVVKLPDPPSETLSARFGCLLLANGTKTKTLLNFIGLTIHCRMLIFIQISDFRLKLHLNKGFWYLNQIACGESGRGWFFFAVYWLYNDSSGPGRIFVTTGDVTGIIWI